MAGLVKYLGDILKPLLTILATVIAAAFLASVASPRADAFIEQRLPVWRQLDPAIETVRGWLGIHREDEDEPWWRFWD